MTIKILLLKSGEEIISNIQEAYAVENGDEKFIGYQLEDPYRVIVEKYEVVDTDDVDGVSRAKIKFLPWLTLSKSKKILIPQDWIVTFYDALETVEESYLSRLGETKDGEIELSEVSVVEESEVVGESD
ncbi:hypothetical protein [Synechococcus phage DSL-LC02]|nr:hypothetical protein [Synechococcus phage DSL-LC02]